MKRAENRPQTPSVEAENRQYTDERNNEKRKQEFDGTGEIFHFGCGTGKALMFLQLWVGCEVRMRGNGSDLRVPL